MTAQTEPTRTDPFARLPGAVDAVVAAATRDQEDPATLLSSLESFLETAARCDDSPSSTIHDPGRRQPTLEALDAAIARLEAVTTPFFGDTTQAPRIALRVAVSARLLARRLRRTARHVFDRPPRDETPFLLADLRDARNALQKPLAHAAAENAQWTAALRERLDDAERRTLLDQANRLVQHAATVEVVDAASARRAFRIARQLESTAYQLVTDAEAPLGSKVSTSECSEAEHDSPTLDTARSRLHAARRRILVLLEEFLERLPPDQDLEVLEAVAPWLLEELDESRVSSAERPTPRGVERLDLLTAFGRRIEHWTVETVRELEGASRQSAQRLLRRIRRPLRRARRQADDHALILRLRGMFGERLVRWWDGLVFWAIVAVLGLLFVDVFRENDADGVIGWTTWADAGVCAILLWDFGFRILLSRRRGDFFLRRAWSDLLPSLPFGLLSSLENVAFLRSTVVFRMLRFLRILRVLRPVLRFGRLFLFLTRAIDRLVERNAWLLDRDIVLFHAPNDEEVAPSTLGRAADLDSWLAVQSSRTLAHSDRELLAEATELRCAVLDLERRSLVALPMADPSPTTTLRSTRRVDVDRVIRTLHRLDDSTVADTVGIEFARDLTSSLRFLRLPLVRRLAFVQYVFGDVSRPDPLLTTARLGRVIGDGLAWLVRTLQWFADLRGTITGAQFLDRLGLQLVLATARPAKRLAIFGACVVFVVLLLSLTHWSLLEKLQAVLWHLLRGPVAILGVVCVVPLAIGIWLRRLAGRVSDFFDRVAEGQFLALTELVKEERSATDREVLLRSVVLPEVLLDRDVAPQEQDEVIRAALGSPGTGAEVLGPRADSVRELVELFYREFLDGAPFHRNDCKVSNMLVGNLTLENVRSKRLCIDKRESDRLGRVHLGSNRVSITGPQLWFRFITQSIAQQTARSILEYNCHCIPIEEMDGAAPEDLALYRSWLERRRRISEARRTNALLDPKALEEMESTAGTLPYRTTHFHALHFLSLDPAREEVVRSRFGDEVLAFLREDRTHLIRDVFGTLPLEDLPSEQRILNPLALYQRHLARGRYLLLPLLALRLVLRGLRLFLRKTVQVVRDVVDPHERPISANAGHADFQVARRKIHRMRRPVAMEALRLRARFDVEYLGIALPGRPPLPESEQVSHDLGLLGASQRERQEIRDLKSRREQQVRTLHRLLQSAADWPDVAQLAERVAVGVPRASERLRAVTLAMICDEQDCCTLLESVRSLRQALERMPESPDKLRLPPLWPSKARRLAQTRFALLVGQERSSDLLLRKRFVRHAGQHSRSLLPFLVDLDRLVREDREPLAQVAGILLQVADQPFNWTEQLVAVRTVQVLSRLDLRGYEELVRELGDFGRLESTSSADDSHL